MSLQKLVRKISIVVLVITLLNLYSFFIYYVNTKDNSNLGFFPRVVKAFSRLPVYISEVYEGLTEEGVTGKVEDSFELKNDLSYDLYALNGNFVGSNWEINLTNLRNDSLIKKWILSDKQFVETERIFSRTGPRTPIILNDKSLITTLDESQNIYRIDENSKVVWHNSQHQYHHHISLDADSNIWAATRKKIYLKEQDLQYWQNGIAKISVSTGEIISHHIIHNILYQNDLQYLIHGSSNNVTRFGHDPIHLNDIEPVLEDGVHWKKGDLFLSFRNKSVILLYRPSTHKVLRVISGPFFNQHDVDIQSDSTISFFNNNVTSLRKIDNYTSLSKEDYSVNDSVNVNMNAEVLVYNFKDSTFTSIFPETFASEKIFTETEGLHHFTAKGDLFIESQNNGKIFILNNKGVVLRGYMNPEADGQVELPHCIRIYEDIEFMR